LARVPEAPEEQQLVQLPAALWVVNWESRQNYPAVQ